MSHIVTKETLMEMLDNDAEYVQMVIGRALVVLMNNQTNDEKDDVQTKYHNGIGFAGSDAKSGTLTAYYWLKNRRLEDWMVEKWMKPNRKGEPRLVKYWRQLDDAAKKKRNS